MKKKEEELDIKDLITKEQRHLLWYDECEDGILLLKFGEVFRCSKEVLRLHILRVETVVLLRKMGVILNEIKTDDTFTILEVSNEHLPAIIALGAFDRRPDVRGEWVRKMEKQLFHFFFPRKPKKKTRLARLEEKKREREQEWLKQRRTIL